MMDSSFGNEVMDWQEDSSLHIIQPASSPWRKRKFDTYNDTYAPYDPNDVYSGYQVTDTLRNLTDVGAPFIDANGQPAHYVTDAYGNTVLQTIVPPQPRQPIGYYLPEFLKWIICGVALLVCGCIELADGAYKHRATVSVHIRNSVKRRLVEVTKAVFAPAPSRRQHRHNVPRHRRRSPIIRRVSPTSPGGRTHIPATPPRARPRATLDEAAVANDDCIFDYNPSNMKHVRSGAFVASAEDDHSMSGITHHPYFEPLMSGAVQDMEMDIDVHSSVIPSFSPYYIPGTFPDSPAQPGLASTGSSTSEPSASADIIISQEVDINEMATSDEQAVDDIATPHREASDELYRPNIQPAIELPLQQVDSRPRNYRGELLNDWQIRICKEFQAIHPPPQNLPQQAISVPKQSQGPNSSELVESKLSPLAIRSPLTLHQQHNTTTTGLIDSRRSPMARVSDTGAADAAMELHGSTAEILHQPHGMTSIGLSDLHGSPLDLQKATSEAFHYPNVQNPIGSSDLRRSPLGLHRATSEDQQPNGVTSIGSNDLHRSPLAYVSPTLAGVMTIDPHDTTSDAIHNSPGTDTIGSIESLRSPLVDVSPVNSLHGTNSTGSIDSPRSPLAEVSLIHRQLGSSPTMPIYPPGSPLTELHTEPAGHAMAVTRGAGSSLPDLIGGAMPVPLRTALTRPSYTMNTMPAISSSKWSIRSLYARVQGKPKKRSPLSERVNNGNIHKAPKTPKKVTWPEHGPVTGTKRFVVNEAMSHPSPSSSREESSLLSSVPSDFSPQPSPTVQEEPEFVGLTHAHPPPPALAHRNECQIPPGESNKFGTVPTTERTGAVQNTAEEQTLSSSSSSDNEGSVKSVETPTKNVRAEPSTPPSSLSPKLEGLTISTRRSSLRRREKEDQAQKLREAIAAEEKARKDKEEAEEKARRDKEEAEERARIKAEEEENERKRTGGRRIPIEKVIGSLPPGWDDKVRINMAKGMREQLAMTSIGNPLTRRDFGMILPQPGTSDDPSGWLNDEVIHGYLQAVVDHGHRAMGHPRGGKPRMHAFNPFFYTTLKDRGYDAVKRWSSRAKIGRNDLKNVEYVFIPCNPSRSHWTLVVVSPVRKTIEVFDSMHGSSVDKVNTTKLWLRGELGHSYVDSEWTVLEDPAHPGRGKGPVQNNANDCGVFAVTTAKMVVLGVDPMAVSAADMPLQRRRLVAELLNGGFSGEFEPHVVFE